MADPGASQTSVSPCGRSRSASAVNGSSATRVTVGSGVIVLGGEEDNMRNSIVAAAVGLAACGLVACGGGSGSVDLNNPGGGTTGTTGSTTGSTGSGAGIFLNAMPPGANGNSAGGIGGPVPGAPVLQYPAHFEDALALYGD